MSNTPIGVALLGGGIFATEAHLPALSQHTVNPISLKAIWSRSEASAEKAQRAWSTFQARETDRPDVFYGQDDASDNSLQALLARKDIHAVIIALPIGSQPDVIRLAIQAGKHILSEKPLGATVSAGRALLDLYNATVAPRTVRPSLLLMSDTVSLGAHLQIWRVAENWEVEPAHLAARQALKDGELGTPQSFSLTAVLFVDNEGDNKYFETEWRKTPEFQGGYLLDAGVHNAAVLRTVLGHRLARLSALTALHNKHLPPTDWLAAVAESEGGVQGQILIDYGARGRSSIWELRVTCSDGELVSMDVLENGVDSIAVEVRKGKLAQHGTRREVFPKTGVLEEQKRFFAAIKGDDDGFGSVEGALADVALLEAALNSDGHERKL